MQHQVQVPITVYIFDMPLAVGLGAIPLGGILCIAKADRAGVYSSGIKGGCGQNGQGDHPFALEVNGVRRGAGFDVDAHNHPTGLKLKGANVTG